MLASDNIANLERQHAGERRNSRIKEQTYLELVSDASAAHTLQQLRVILRDKTLTKAEALTKQKHVLAHGSTKQEVMRERTWGRCVSEQAGMWGAMRFLASSRRGPARKNTCVRYDRRSQVGEK